MRDATTIMRERQSAVRREMDRRGIAPKQVEFDSGIPYSTLLSYFPAPGGEREPANIPMAAVFALVEGKALPLDMLALLLPTGFLIVAVPDVVDHDVAAEAMRSYLHTKDRAHHPESPAGREIANGEDADLRARLAVVPRS
jgi:hypothetical protein